MYRWVRKLPVEWAGYAGTTQLHLALRRGCSEVLQLVFQDACDPLPDDALFMIAWGQVDVAPKLRLAVEHRRLCERRLPPLVTHGALVEAGYSGELASAQYLRSLGAVWPRCFIAPYSQSMHTPGCGYNGWYYACRTLPLLQWALAEGSTWQAWDSGCCRRLVSNYCDFLGVEGVPPALDSASTVTLLEWVHENGAPCGCARPWQMLPRRHPY